MRAVCIMASIRYPMNEYFDIAATYGGTVINMSTYTDNYVNSLAMDVWNLDQNDTKGWIREKGEFVALLKQANTDSSKMAEVIGVSEAQLRFVTNSQSGMGLLKCGNVVISFDNQISKDTSLYKLYNTNLHEKVEMEKKGQL